MKKVVILIGLIIFNFMFAEDVLAAEEYLVKVRDTTTYVYASASSSSTVLETVYADSIHSLLSITKSGYYYKITTEEGNTGYIKSSNVVAFIDMSSDLSETSLACVADLEKEGFGDSGYIPYLCFLQLQHSNWTFEAIETNLDWEDAVAGESDCSKETKSYIYLSSSVYNYYADYVNSSCYNTYEDSSSAWYPASYLAVEYHMDPRSFLSEDYIFQFESLLYDDSMSSIYEQIVTGIVSGSDVYSTVGDSFPYLINSAGEAKNVNPTFLAARIIQELGTDDTLFGLYSGKYTGYTGLYNFVNWSVSDDCATDSGAVVCGLTYAREAGWESVTLALEGAASLISSSYISLGQYTTYLQKYNVVPTDSSDLYYHQYQTNIEAPSSEAWMTYTSYKSSGKLTNAFLFKIPVYNNMSVLVEGSYSSGSDDDNGYSTSSIETLVKSAGYDYSASYISGIEIGTTVSEVLSNIESGAGSGNVTITDSSKKTVTSGIMMTGYEVNITNSSGTTTLIVVIYGDTSGDGDVTALDLLQVQKNIVGLYTLSGAYKEAGDTSKDGSITALDLLQVQKDIVNLYTIEQ